MKQERTCSACGGRLVLLNHEVMQCKNCKKLYYISVDRTHKIKIHIPLTHLVRILLAGLGLTILLIGGYWSVRAGLGERILKTVEETASENSFASHLSDIFREFVTKALGCEASELTRKDLDRFQYLYVDYQQDYYIFRYSFENYYDYDSAEEFEKTVKEIRVCRFDKDICLGDVARFKKLTRLEAYASTWCDYRLAAGNKIRSIYCNGSPYVKEDRRMFDETNPETLEEFQMKTCYGICTLEGSGRMKKLRTLRVNMYYQTRFVGLEEAQSVETLYLDEAGDVGDFSPVGELTQLKNLSIDRMSGRDITFLTKLERLENLSIGFCSFDQNALEMLLKQPSIQSITLGMGGTSSISWQQLEELQQRYPDKLRIEE